ncbi:hypothetical protein ACFVS7_27850 [Streptomyces rubiginosohelvolus]|uniref:hypothetical protein n=1 Tax=Streptomyces rubiginosohelvolus TaxID=67362 RepID=UPI0036D7A469
MTTTDAQPTRHNLHTYDVEPWPLANLEQILQAVDPVKPATQQRLRTLKAKSLSAGLLAPLSGEGRLAGRISLFCDLNIDAAVLRRQGNEELAADYRSAASALEDRLLKLLQESHVQLDELYEASRPRSLDAWKVLRSFTRDCRQARDQLQPVPNERVITGILREHRGDNVRFFPESDGSFIDLPVEVLRRLNLSIGDPVVMVHELIASGVTVTRVRAGVCLPELDEFVEHEEDRLDIRARQPFTSPEDRRKFLEAVADETPLRKRAAG